MQLTALMVVFVRSGCQIRRKQLRTQGSQISPNRKMGIGQDGKTWSILRIVPLLIPSADAVR